jgi:hypothetical protein
MDLDDAGKSFRFFIRDRHTKSTAMLDTLVVSAGCQ